MATNKNDKDQSYDIRKIYEEMELDLIRSMKRNLERHKNEELEVGFKFEQWQSAKLRDLERFRRENRAILGAYEPEIERHILVTLAETYRDSQEQVSRQIEEIRNEIIEEAKIKFPGDLEPILGETVETIKTTEPEPIKESVEKVIEDAVKWKEAPRPLDDVFFRTNDDKFNALVESVGNDFEKANTAVLRRMDDVYRQTIFKAQVHFNTGSITLDQAIDMATKDFLKKGIDAITYSDGKKVNIASYVEMALRTANHRAYLMGEGKKRQEMGLSLVVVSAHATSCELCVPWQGLIIIDDVYSGGKKDDGPYQLLSTAMDAGLMHPNCRHNLSTYFPGITTLPKVPDGEKALENYKYEQQQRCIERQIRKYKRLEAGSVDLEHQKKYKKKVREWQARQRKHLKENPQLRRAYGREKPGPGISNKDVKIHEETLKQKAIDDKIKDTREYIKSDACNKKIHEGRQGKHIKGHNNYEGKSYLLEDVNPQEIVDKYAGTGDLKFSKKMEWTKKEFITAEENIGVSVNPDTGEETLTKYFSISYAKKGTHVVPRKPEKEESND